ncbi:MAG TPA: vWA domain-containing protein [Symbiobacteriaceae bacterium]|jgi:Ca-activated chloride channel family protein
MLEGRVKLHRAHLQADCPSQKLFVALTLRPAPEAVAARPQLAVALVVDTSTSMRDPITQPPAAPGHTVRLDADAVPEPAIAFVGVTKMDLVAGAIASLLESDLLRPEDRVAVVKFDDDAEVLLPLASPADRDLLRQAVGMLGRYSGGSRMGEGMWRALGLMEAEQRSRKLILLTDGQAHDEPVVAAVTQRLARAGIPVTAVGIGNDWNEDLLTSVTDRTQGKPLHVVSDAAAAGPAGVRPADLPVAMLTELERMTREVVTNLRLDISAIANVTLDRVTRVYPFVNEVDLSIQPYPLGSVEADDAAVFVLELTLPARAAVRVRLAQLVVTYDVPGPGMRRRRWTSWWSSRRMGRWRRRWTWRSCTGFSSATWSP